MKKTSLKRILRLLIMTGMLAVAPAMLSSAAARPGFVRSLKANVEGNKATLTWTKVSDATGYNVYEVDPETSDIIKRVKQTTGLTCTVTVKAGETHSYQVFAYKKSGSRTLENEEGSPPVDVEVETLRVIGYGNGCAFLEWDKVRKASGYVLYVYDEDDEDYIEYETFKATKTSCKVEIPEGETYTFIMRSYRNVRGENVFSEDSNELDVEGKKQEAVHGRRWGAYLKTNLKAKSVENDRVVTLKKGTRVMSAACSVSQVEVTVLRNGKEYVLNGSYLKYTGMYFAPSYDYYGKAQSEDFINSRKYASNTKYLVWINQYTASVHIFKGSKGKWTQVLMVPCIIGSDRGYTKSGEFQIIRRDGGHVYFYWNASKNWGQSFHGWVDSNRWGSYSAGCVRVDYSTFAYINALPLGTKVISY